MTIKLPKEELIKDIRRIVDVDETVLNKVLNCLHLVIINRLKSNHEIQIPHLCSFHVKTLKPRVVNLNNKVTHVPSRKSITIRPSSLLLKKIRE